MNRVAPKLASRNTALFILVTVSLAGLVGFSVVVESHAVKPLAPLPTSPGPIVDVDRFDDDVTATACTAAANDCSLRGAVISANAVSGTTVNVPAGIYSLTIAGASEQFAAAGDLDVRANFTTIIGAGAASTVIQQTTTDRVFEINPTLSSGFNFTISGVTIKGGTRATGSGGGLISGGHSNSTTITDCVFDSNRVTGTLAANGGAISDSSSSGPSNLTISGTTFTNNTTQTGSGGAIRFNSTGTLTLTGNRFIGNRANTNSGGAVNALGTGSGGVYNISQNSFEGNQASGASSRGGAVFAGSGVLSLRYSRLVGNTAGSGVGTAVARSIGSAGSISVEDNWWGTNSGPTPTSVFGALVSNWLQLRFTAAPLQVQTGGTANLAADILGNSTGGEIDAANLVGLPPFPSTPGTIFINPAPELGTISGASTQFVNGQATATYTAGSQAGSDDVTASADDQTLTINIGIAAEASISCPTDITVQTDPGECTATVAFAPSAAGSPAPTVGCSIGSTPITSPHSFPVGTTIVTCTASNGVGPDASCSFTVTVTDGQAPQVTAPSNVTVNTGPGATSCGAVISDTALGTASTSDNCSGTVSVTRSGMPAGNIFPVGTTTVTYTASDANGNTSSATQTVTVIDNTAPTVAAPSNASYECAANVPAGSASQASASDNCGTATVTYAESNNGGVGSAASALIITRVFTATDAAGNKASATQTITVIDNTAPTLSVPGPTSVSADAYCHASVPNLVVSSTASDNCAGIVTITQSPAAGTSLGIGTHTITVTATDAAGNTTTANTSLTVNDTSAPSITAPSNVTVNTGSEADTCGTLVSDAMLGSASTSDNCGGAVTVTRSGVPAGNIFPVGSTTITYTATDANGNTATATQIVTVIDDTAPTVTAPASASYECAADVPGGNASQATASDSCGTATVTLTESNNGGTGSSASPLVITRVYTATDAAGNTASATQTITVIDTTAPTLSAPAPTTVSADSYCQAAVPNVVVSSSASDNCAGGVTITQSPVAGTPLGVGTHTITITATDVAGNTTTATTSLTIVDTTAPSVTAPPSITVPTGSGSSCSVVISDAQLGTAGSSDNCGGSVSVTRSGVPSGNIFPVGQTVITYTATDAAGNASASTQVVNVVDGTAPVITLNGPNPLMVECHTGFVDPGAAATDNCGGSFAAAASGTVNTNVPGTYTITYNAVDASGNQATPVMRTVIVKDSTAPVITVNSQPISLWAPNHNYKTVSVADLVLSVADSCNTSIDIFNVVVASVTSDEPDDSDGDGNTRNDMLIAPDCKSVQLRAERNGNSNGRVYTITLKVRDSAGNVGIATKIVTVPRTQNGASAINDGPRNTVTGNCP